MFGLFASVADGLFVLVFIDTEIWPFGPPPQPLVLALRTTRGYPAQKLLDYSVGHWYVELSKRTRARLKGQWRPGFSQL